MNKSEKEELLQGVCKAVGDIAIVGTGVLVGTSLPGVMSGAGGIIAGGSLRVASDYNKWVEKNVKL